MPALRGTHQSKAVPLRGAWASGTPSATTSIIGIPCHGYDDGRVAQASCLLRMQAGCLRYVEHTNRKQFRYGALGRPERPRRQPRSSGYHVTDTMTECVAQASCLLRMQAGCLRYVIPLNRKQFRDGALGRPERPRRQPRSLGYHVTDTMTDAWRRHPACSECRQDACVTWNTLIESSSATGRLGVRNALGDNPDHRDTVSRIR